MTHVYSHEKRTTNQIRRSHKNDQSIISWLYYGVSWKYDPQRGLGFPHDNINYGVVFDYLIILLYIVDILFFKYNALFFSCLVYITICVKVRMNRLGVADLNISLIWKT